MRRSVREKGIRRFEVTNAGSVKLSLRSAQRRLEASWFHEPIRKITNPILFLPHCSADQTLEWLLLRRCDGALRQKLVEEEAMNLDQNSNRPDEELARLAGDGDAAAFDEIYRRHRRFVYNLAVRMTGNIADAEDLTQESFVSVFRRVGSFRAEAAFTTWLYRLVSNQVKMHFRHRNSRRETYTSELETLEELRPRRPGLSDRAQPLIDRLAIEQALRMLPPGYREAFTLFDLEGYNHEEAARLSGHTAGTSKSQLHKARASLRAVLSKRSPALQT
jgi:RNA polymerase sigma-70 factor (ECF subfamily)